MSKTMEVWLGNYGAYNAGHLLDQPVELPATQEKIDSIMSSIRAEAERLTGSPCEEFYISDYDGYPIAGAEQAFSMYADIHDLNLLAAAMTTIDESQVEAISEWLDRNAVDLNIDQVTNAVLQAEEVPFYRYETESDTLSPQEKYGLDYLESSGVADRLEDVKMPEGMGSAVSYFDAEALGRDCELSGNVTLCENGYIDNRAKLDLDYYTHAEIVEEVAARIESTLPDLARELEGQIAGAQAREVRQELSQGQTFYNPTEQRLYAWVKANEQGAPLFVEFEGVTARDVRTAAESGQDLASYMYGLKDAEARGNFVHFGDTEEAVAEIGEGGSRTGWYYAEAVANNPDLLKLAESDHAAQKAEPASQKAAPAKQSSRMAPGPSMKAPVTPDTDARAAAQAARAQAGMSRNAPSRKEVR